jgi:hypothetical protein
LLFFFYVIKVTDMCNPDYGRTKEILVKYTCEYEVVHSLRIDMIVSWYINGKEVL